MTKPRRLLGVDFGITGGATLLIGGGPIFKSVEVWDIPIRRVGGHNMVDARAWQEIVRWAAPEVAYVELTWAIPHRMAGKGQGQGVVAAGRTQRAHGVLEGILACELELGRLLYVIPQRWKGRFGLEGKNKQNSRALAAHYFPAQADLFGRVADDGRAESALIALYGAEKEKMVRLT